MNSNIKIVYKPWGKEHWLELNSKYCYKRIYINAGHRTSYQYHNFKIETNYLISGKAMVWLENDDGIIENYVIYNCFLRNWNTLRIFDASYRKTKMDF